VDLFSIGELWGSRSTYFKPGIQF